MRSVLMLALLLAGGARAQTLSEASGDAPDTAGEALAAPVAFPAEALAALGGIIGLPVVPNPDKIDQDWYCFPPATADGLLVGSIAVNNPQTSVTLVWYDLDTEDVQMNSGAANSAAPIARFVVRAGHRHCLAMVLEDIEDVGFTAGIPFVTSDGSGGGATWLYRYASAFRFRPTPRTISVEGWQGTFGGTVCVSNAPAARALDGLDATHWPVSNDQEVLGLRLAAADVDDELVALKGYSNLPYGVVAFRDGLFWRRWALDPDKTDNPFGDGLAAVVQGDSLRAWFAAGTSEVVLMMAAGILAPNATTPTGCARLTASSWPVEQDIVSLLPIRPVPAAGDATAAVTDAGDLRLCRALADGASQIAALRVTDPATGATATAPTAWHGAQTVCATLPGPYAPGPVTLDLVLTGRGVYHDTVPVDSTRATLDAVVSADAAPSPAASLAVAPNPVAGAGAVTLSLASPAVVRVTLLDALGRAVAVLHDGPASGSVRLPLPGLPPGLYTVRAVDARGGASAARVAVVR